MKDKKTAGFEEVSHTADRSLQVWAPDTGTLFEQAAQGMYALMQPEYRPGSRIGIQLSLEAADLESLLVTFLNELLYYTERDGLAFDRFSVQIQDHRLTADLRGRPAASIRKEIKAVTFHNLHIKARSGSFYVTLVFDV